jgi:hypothetical protein
VFDHYRTNLSRRPRTLTWRGATVLVAILLSLGGCGAATPTAAPSAPAASAQASTSAPAAIASPAPTATDPWLDAELVQPSAVTSAPTLAPGFQCHPCHFLEEEQLFGVGAAPGGLIAVGVEQPPAQAVAFFSADGQHWVALPGFTGVAGTTAIATASSGTRSVIVGLDPTGATAWASSAGGPWSQAPKQPDLLVPYAAGAMTSVAAFGSGFVAGGYRDDPLHVKASAAVWRSDDGLTWHLDGGAGIFAGGRIWGIAARAGTIVAVGTNGDPIYGPAAILRWTQADGWQRGRIGPDDSGAIRAVAVTPTGFVAVGLNGKDTGARTWTSSDGLDWTAAPDQPAFLYYGLPVRMQSVVAGPFGLVAGGWRSDAGKGSSVTWTSTDGVTWQGPVWESSFSGGQITGVAVSTGGVVAVGRTGYPDWNQAWIWRNPTP